MILKFEKFINENRSTELSKVKNQFIDYLNSNRKHWIKSKEISIAMFQGFCQRYDNLGQRDEDERLKSTLDGSRPYGYKFQPIGFHNKYPELFTQDVLNSWFNEWKEMELIKSK